MTTFALKNPVSVIVLAAILFITGVVSFRGMRKESFPEIKIPYIFVTTVYPGANPPEIENCITRKIEDKLDGLDGVKKMTSSSNEGYSSIFLEFDPTVRIEDALRRVKDKVDQTKGDLPTDARDPVTQELNFSTIPIVTVALFADYDLERLESLAENLKERMAKIPGVLEAKVLGKQEKEIAIDADPALLEQYGISLQELVAAVQSQHCNIPGGTIKAAGFRFSIKVTGELASPEEFGELVVRANSGRVIRLRDVAKISFTYTRDRPSISRTNGNPSLTLTVAKRTGEDIVRIADDVKKIIAEENSQWPAGTHYEVTFDLSKGIRDMVDELQNHLLMGILLVLLVLGAFLGVRNSIFISAAIPFSMAIGFIVLSFMGVTLNMVVLFSLVMALGMLVDDGIVVVENIFRHMQMGKSRLQAALDGTKEVMVPVFTATLTTLCAFAPVLWMPGIMGQFMKYLPLTVGITLTGSLFVAFVFNPVFASLTMNNHTMPGEGNGKTSMFDRFKNAYRAILRRTIRHPVLLALFCLFFVVTGIFAYAAFGPGVVFFPDSEPEVASIEIEGPLSQDISFTDSVLRLPEYAALTMPQSIASLKTVSAIAGAGKSQSFTGGQTESNKGYFDVVFSDYKERAVSSFATMKWMEDSLGKLVPGWKLRVLKQQNGPPTGKPVELEVTGDDYSQLSWMADSLKRMIERVPGLTNVNQDYDPARPEIMVDVDRKQAKVLGCSTADIAMAVRSAIYGTEAAKYRVGKNEYKIMVRLTPEVREDLNVFNQIVLSRDGRRIPLSSVATISQTTDIASIRHVDGKRTVQVWAELAPGQKDESKPKAMAMSAAKKIKTPAGYSIQPGSGNRDQAESQEFLVKAFFVALSLVFLIMVFQFNSLFQPLLILIGILLSLGGVFWGLLLTNKLAVFMNFLSGGTARIPEVTFSILFSGIGIIALAGVVAKNGIVLIDFMNKLQREGRSLLDAVIEGGATRLRPVLLTAITAMIGLVPMATGVGIDFLHLGFVTRSETTQFWAPMAWAIFWGLLFNTTLVLIVTPTFYYMWEQRKIKARAKKEGRAGRYPAIKANFSHTTKHTALAGSQLEGDIA
jgi:multidrug efflux pump